MTEFRTLALWFLSLVTLSGSVTPASAQSVPRWSVEVHGGISWLRVPEGGDVSMPPGGPPITTSSPIFPSRAVSSWLFGDGATLLNDVNREFGLDARVTPLDAALAALGLDVSNDAAFGVRFTGAVTERYAVEVSVDVLPGAAAFTDDLSADVEATRASFVSAFDALLATGPFVSPVVSADARVSDGGVGHDILATVSAVYTWPGRSTEPYVLLGGGIWAHAGELPTASLDAGYRFDILGAVPIDERDRVTIRYDQDLTFTGVVGGGLRQALGSRWGLQADGRLFMTKSSARFYLDATPTVATLTPPGFIESFTSPAVQFSNNPSTGRQSSLSGAPIDSFEVFSGSGLQTRFLATVGVYVKF